METRNLGIDYKKWYTIAVTMHSIYVLIGLCEGAQLMMLFNIVLAAGYLGLVFMLDEIKYQSVCYNLCVLFILGHMCGLTIFCGWEAGAMMLAPSIVILTFYLVYSHRTNDKTYILRPLITTSIFLLGTVIITTLMGPIYNFSLASLVLIRVLSILISMGITVTFSAALVTHTLKVEGSLEEENAELVTAANFDKLTKALNRRTFGKEISRYVKNALGYGREFGLFMCDIDDFKMVNDTYGHDTGDLILKTVVKVMTSELGPNDRLFRWGGEEILILMEGRREECTNKAEACRAAVEASKVTVAEKDIGVTITLGGCIFYKGRSEKEMIERADKNLYKGKSSGKNCVVM